MKIPKYCRRIIEKLIFPHPVGFDLPEDYFENDEYLIDREENEESKR